MERRGDAAMLALSGLAPACLAAAHLGNVADAAHDAGVTRVLGLSAGPWRGLDVLAGALFAVAPVGTRAARAELGAALVTATAGVVLYVIVRALLEACAETTHLRFVVASIATLAALVAAPWQIEGAAVGGSATGALLVLLPIALMARPRTDSRHEPWKAVALALGFAVGYEPLVGLCALGGLAVQITASKSSRCSLRAAWQADRGGLAAGFLAGLAPLLIASARVRAGGEPLVSSLAESWSGERGASPIGWPAEFVHTEIGGVLSALAVAGCALAGLVPRARPTAAALLVVTVLGLICPRLGEPLGPTRFGAPVLAAVASACALAAVAMQAIVRTLARARVPFARASAAMVVLLELVLPVDSADEGLLRTLPRAEGAAAAWDDLAWGVLPPRSVVLVTDPRIHARALAARAGAALRDDVVVAPAYLYGALARRAFASDAALLPLWRDVELIGSPTEVSLGSLAATRPVVMAYELKWGRVLGRHLVPIALLDRFEPEPRGASDRRRALESFAAKRDRLERLTANDPELSAATVYLLRARASYLGD